MGLIRLLLAISVVLVHSNSIFGIYLLDARYAVQLFYMISGFYMSLILNEKYLNKSYKLFISNRLLRLYPIYFVVLVVTIIYSFSTGILFNDYGRITPFINYLLNIKIGYYLILAALNLSIIGQDIVFYLGLDTISGNLFFTTNFHNTQPQIHQFLIVPQSWTLSIEMYFYMIAPFIVRKRSYIIIILVVTSLALRVIWFYNFSLYKDPWVYRFFPFELFFFLSGSLGYKLYIKIKALSVPKILNYIIITYMLLFILLYHIITINIIMKTLLLFISLFISMPFIFNFTKYYKIDRFIGELSYPVYIVHMLIGMILIKFIPLKYLGIAVSLVSIFVSMILIKYVSEPIETFRQSRILTVK